jgi:hypothetical protein
MNSVIKEYLKSRILDNYVECYGDFDLSDVICRKYCALRLRCAIEQKEQFRIEQIEEMLAVNEIALKVQ